MTAREDDRRPRRRGQARSALHQAPRDFTVALRHGEKQAGAQREVDGPTTGNVRLDATASNPIYLPIAVASPAGVTDSRAR
jgi:hypothetical protein